MDNMIQTIKKQKHNWWIIISIILIAIIILLSSLIINRGNYDFGAFKIKPNTLNDLSNQMEGKPFKLCSPVNNQCYIMGRIEK